ncbi:thioredoxin reductase [Paenibacillus sp. 598K]|uniref:NAD(P)/FAD-dependent oxidoreductase n=1 Tax=Paenibacillus sp. 598K TaxID=1117987 RepID=UPI000FFA1894|nr:NAD(P)/FAD-dependent oxidoreductase [Paenibacillus sp. 598K]GBF74813.1 thioredoxin reductase [Paenibacillus sp. 598K]
MQPEELYDLTIIGGGPAGMYAAFYAGMREMRVKIIEGREELGGFLHTYSEKMIWDVGGIPPIRCARLIEHLAEQAVTFMPTLVFGQRVETMERSADGVIVLGADTGALHYTRTVLIAVGRGVAELQKLELEGAERYELTNLHYTVSRVERFRDKRVLISGGGNSAVDWALELAEVAAHVTVVHRKDEFRAMERNVTIMRETLDVRTPCQIERLHGQGDHLYAVTLTDLASGAEALVEVDEVIVNHGYNSSFGALSAWGLELEDGLLRVDADAAASMPGVYGAGDCVVHPGKVRLIAGAFTDAALAVNSAKQYLEPDAHAMAYVSSHNELFRERNKSLTRR